MLEHRVRIKGMRGKKAISAAAPVREVRFDMALRTVCHPRLFCPSRDRHPDRFAPTVHRHPTVAGWRCMTDETGWLAVGVRCRVAVLTCENTPPGSVSMPPQFRQAVVHRAVCTAVFGQQRQAHHLSPGRPHDGPPIPALPHPASYWQSSAAKQRQFRQRRGRAAADAAALLFTPRFSPGWCPCRPGRTATQPASRSRCAAR